MTDDDGRKGYLLESERLQAEEQDSLRWRARKMSIRRSQLQQAMQQELQAAEHLLKKATVYDGMGNVEAAIKHYRQFLEHFAVDERLMAFARERLDALGEEGASGTT